MKISYDITACSMIFIVATVSPMQCFASQESILKKSALHAAAAANMTSQCRSLLEKDSSVVNRLDTWRHTPLHYAAYHGNYELCKLLIHYGGTDSISIPDENRNTPLHYAAMKGHHHICCLLKIHNASLTKINNRGQRPYDLIPQGMDTDYVSPLDISDDMVFDMEVSLKDLLRPSNDVPAVNNRLETIEVCAGGSNSEKSLSHDNTLKWKNIVKPLFIAQKKSADELERDFLQQRY
jgi:ankyrin repeat protein